MKVVSTGKRYDLYDDSLRTYDQLPAKSYVVRFHPKMGFYLEEYAEIEVKEEKVYGCHVEKVNKVLNSFNKIERNLGVILSGDKGIGKSLFAKMLMEAAVNNNLPVIIVDSFAPGIASYLEEIEQEVLVMFDEFDKTFADIKVGENEADPQAGLLSLFDGLSQGKKLFVVTCNSLRKLSDYLVNRPGRFHYHFRFNYPSDEQVIEYLQDKLEEQYYPEIDKVVVFSKKVNLNYDCLRAIAFELNMGTPFEVAIQDLNIINTREQKYTVVVYCKNGKMLKRTDVSMDLFADEEVSIYFYHGGRYVATMSFNTSNCMYNPAAGQYIVKGDNIDVGDLDDDDEDQEKERNKYVPDYAVIIRNLDKDIHYAV